MGKANTRIGNRTRHEHPLQGPVESTREAAKRRRGWFGSGLLTAVPYCAGPILSLNRIPKGNGAAHIQGEFSHLN